MKIRPQHRKLFYVPGMISLVMIPLLCLWFVNTNKYFFTPQGVGFAISDTISDVASDFKDKRINTFAAKAYVPKRNFKTYVFNGNNDEQKLKDLVVPLRKMVDENDTINGMKFTFGKHAKYQNLIDAIDMLIIYNSGYYVCHQNNIYAYEIPKKKPTGKQVHITPFTCHVYVDEDVAARAERERQFQILMSAIKKFWQIPLAFFAIVLLNIYMLIKFNKRRIYNQKTYI